jgi:hypothetical protein
MRVIYVPPGLLRRVVWDIVEDEKIPKYSEALGISPASDDVNAEEQHAAYHRLALLNPVGNSFSMLTYLASEVLTRSLFADLGMDVSDDDVARVHAVLQSGCQAVLAEMLDLQLLAYGPAINHGGTYERLLG